jgi:hypothetical protein
LSSKPYHLFHLHVPLVFTKTVIGRRFRLVNDGSELRQDTFTFLRKGGKLLQQKRITR